MRGFWPTLIVGIGTYMTRASFILVFAKREVPPRLQRALRNVGPAVLAALVASLMVGDQGWSAFRRNAEFISLAFAIGVAVKTRNMAWTLVAGMVSVWALAAVL